MSEIQRLTPPASAFNTMPSHRGEAQIRHFGQLLAQIPPEEHGWAKAAEVLAGVSYIDETGQPQAYVVEDVLTDAAKQRIQAAREQLQQQTGATQVSTEQGARLLLIQALTTQYAQHNDQAAADRAQELQTALNAELNPQPEPEAVNEASEPSLTDLENFLEGQLQRLNIGGREAFQNSTIDLGDGEFAVNALLNDDMDDRAQLEMLINIAAQLLQIQQEEPAQAAVAEPQAPPVVEPVKVADSQKLFQGELYEFESNGTDQINVIKRIARSLSEYATHLYYGSTYHLQFFDQNGDLMYLGSQEGASPGSDHLSVYWHGLQQSDGTVYSMEGDLLAIRRSGLVMDQPVVSVATDSGLQYLRMDQIPFHSVQISMEGNRPLRLPTQADVDTATAALQNPQNLSLQELMQYTTPALQRSGTEVAELIEAASEEDNIQQIIRNAFSGKSTAAEITETTRELSNYIIANRRGFERIEEIDEVFFEHIDIQKRWALEAIKLQIINNESPWLGERAGSIQANISGDINMRNMDFAGYDLSGQVLYRLDLRDANLEGINLTNATLIDVKLDGANLKAANLTGAQLGNVSLRNASLENADFRQARLKDVDLHAAELNSANLNRVDLRRTQLSQANLSGADLERTNLIKTELSGTNFQGANLRNALMVKAKLSDTNLSTADLSNARLDATMLFRVNLNGALLLETRFIDATIHDLNIDQNTLENSQILQQQSKPDYDLKGTYSSDSIAQITSVTSLSDLEKRLDQKVESLSYRELVRVLEIVIPQIRQQQNNLILLGMPARDGSFAHFDFAHKDLRQAQINGSNFFETDFSYANLQGAYLHGINISGSTIVEGSDGYGSLNFVNMRNAHLEEAKLSHISAIGAQLQGANLKRAELTNLDLSGADLSAADVSGAKLQLDLSKVDLSNLIYDDKTQWNGSTLSVKQIQDLNLSVDTDDLSSQWSSLPDDTRLIVSTSYPGFPPYVMIAQDKALKNAVDEIPELSEPLASRGTPDNAIGAMNFDGLNINGKNLSEVYLSGSSFKEASLRSVNFRDTLLKQANFHQADLREANFENTNISHANLQQARLNDASLVNAIAWGTNFSGANMNRSDLSGADLRHAKLIGTNLKDVNMHNTNLRGADLSNADLSRTDLYTVRHDETTIWRGAKLSEDQIRNLDLSPEQLAPDNMTTPGHNSQDLDIGHNPVAPTDNSTTNSLQNSSFNQDGFSGLSIGNTLNPFNSPNGLTDRDGTQAGHGDGNNNRGTITAVAGDAEQPDHSFKVINGQVVVGDTVLLPELDLSNTQNTGGLFNIPLGLPELPTYTPATKPVEEGGIPVADTTSSTQADTTQSSGVTWGGQLGSKPEAEKTNAEIESLLGKGWRQGLRPDLPPTTIDNRIPGFGEGLPPAGLENYNTGWGQTDIQITLQNEQFPEGDETLTNILNPNGKGRPQHTFPRATDKDRLPEIHQQVLKALPELETLTYAQYSQLSPADQQQILKRSLDYQQLTPANQAKVSLIDYLDSSKTSDTQRRQLNQLNAEQNVHQARLNTIAARTGLNENTVELINSRIKALQANIAQLNQHTQAIQNGNAQRLAALTAQAKTDPIGVAFIKPTDAVQSRPQAELNSNTPSSATAIPRFMVIRSENGPQLMENLPNGRAQIHFYPLAASTPITQQLPNGAWAYVPDVGQIGGKLFLDLLLTQGALKMLNNGGPVQAPDKAPGHTQPQTPSLIPQPNF